MFADSNLSHNENETSRTPLSRACQLLRRRSNGRGRRLTFKRFLQNEVRSLRGNGIRGHQQYIKGKSVQLDTAG